MRKTIVIAVLILIVTLLFNMAGVAERQLYSASPDDGADDDIKLELTGLADETILFSKDAKERFVAEVLEIYDNAGDCDVVIYFCEGGWGSRPLSVNPEGRSLVTGIASTLTSMGYTYCIADYPRTRKTAGDYLYEGVQLVLQYPAKSKQLAAKMDFLTGHVDDLKVIIVGKSSGALYVNKAAELLRDNPDIYTIQIGSPLGCKTPVPGSSMAVCDNGIQGDAMIKLDVLSLIKQNKLQVLFILFAPSFTTVDWIIGKILVAVGFCNTRFPLVMPGHDYMWHYPKVGPAIETFLQGVMGNG
jgi:hypothetical protein